MDGLRFLRAFRIPLLFLGILLGPSIGAGADGGGRLLIFNTLADLLKGDLWEFVPQNDVGRHLYVHPENHQVIGIGTTNWAERMGEVMVHGTVGKTVFLWANPEYPYQIRRMHDGTFPWIQIAIVDPGKGLKWNMERTPDLHGAIIEQMRREGIRMCALSVEAVTQRVEYSLTFRIPKTGLDLSVPGGSEAYLRAFQDESRSRWVMYGIYVDEELAHTCGMVSGQPLLMAGYNRDTSNGGLVRLAKVQSAEVQYYPLQTSQVLKSDLKVDDVRYHEGRVSVDVKNEGALTAEHVKVRLTLPDSKREMEAVIASLKPQEEVTVRFNIKRSPLDKLVVVHVDPDEQILESDRKNNRAERKQGLLGW